MKSVLSLLIFCLSLSSFAQISFSRLDLGGEYLQTRNIIGMDYNEDGNVDVFASAIFDSKVVLFHSFGDNYVESGLGQSIQTPHILKSFDLDQDGDQDLIATSITPPFHRLVWWRAHSGNLVGQADLGVVIGDFFKDLGFGDMDGDGDIDIISIDQDFAGDGKLEVWENDNMVFTAHTIETPNLGPSTLEVVDWNEDGMLDFFVAGASDSLVRGRLDLWLNEGSLSFAKTEYFDCDCDFIDLIDLDEDSDLDFVAANFTSDTIRYWLNEGNDNFQPFLIDDEHRSPSDIIAADIDMDNDLDIVLSFRIAETLVIYENDGSLNFTERIVDENFTMARDIHVMDMNNDELPDILGAGSEDANAVIWINESGLVNTYNFELSTEAQVFPNPTTAWLNVTTELDAPEKYQITDQLGRILRSEGYSNQLNLGGLPGGTYYLKIMGNEEIEMHKIVIR